MPFSDSKETLQPCSRMNQKWPSHPGEEQRYRQQTNLGCFVVGEKHTGIVKAQSSKTTEIYPVGNYYIIKQRKTNNTFINGVL